MKLRYLLPVVLATGAALATPVFAQRSGAVPPGPSAVPSDDPAVVHERTAPVIHAEHLTGRIAVDGRLDDPAWRLAPVVTGFTQTDPIDGARPSERTEVRIAYDAEAIYVGARMWDDGPISTRLGGRDAWFSDSDWLTVVFDSYHAHQGGYRFRINPSGVKGDDANGDGSWDPVWDAAVRVDSAGWSVEMRIPFSQLRFNPSLHTWGVQVSRNIARKAEHDVFSYTPKGEAGGAARYGHLTGLVGIEEGHRLELLPYVAARGQYGPVASNAAFINPFSTGSDYTRQVGADIKFKITPNITLDGTINPDFGQVEADAATVNLSASESYFGERRPFFVEGASIFGYGRGDLFYSRRIGRAPEGGVPDSAVYADVPSTTSILGAAKLTGRTANGWSVGTLDAVTPRTFAPWVDAADRRHDSEVEPLSNYFVGRIKRDFRQGQTTIGAILTSVVRSLDDSALTSRLRDRAVAAGVDFRHEFDDRTWALSGAATDTWIHGAPSAIAAAESSSIRYYQRPDADYLGVDSTATTLGGYRAMLALDKQAGRHWLGGVSGSATSPGYETNDLGFLTGTDRLSYGSHLMYRDEIPGTVLRRWDIRATTDGSWNYAGNLVGNWARLQADATLLDYWSGAVAVHHFFPTLDDRLTRGGPLAANPGGTQLEASLSSDGRDPYAMGAWTAEGATPAGGWWSSQGLHLGVKTSSVWTADVVPSYSRSHGTAQYVTTVSDTTDDATFGHRYVFADIDQTTLSLAMSMNVTVAPTLTVAVMAQPFLASGRFGGPKELAAPRTYDFRPYSVDGGSARDSSGTWTVDPDGAGPASPFTYTDPSFNSRALNGTASVRWDWRPGSTMYLVWQQRRASTGTAGDFELTRDAEQLMHADAENTVTFKVNYWLNP